MRPTTYKNKNDYLAMLSNELFIFIFVSLLDNGGN